RGVHVLLGRGDEEPIEVVSTEGAGSRLGSADLDEAVESPVRAVAVDGTAVGHRGPYAPLGIDGEPIGQAALGQLDEDAAVSPSGRLPSASSTRTRRLLSPSAGSKSKTAICCVAVSL